MRIRIVQSGGLAGLRRERIVETERLPEGGREVLEDLVRTCAFFDLPKRSVSGLPDVIQYRVCVEWSGRSHEVTFDDETASERLRDLVARTFTDAQD